MFINKLFNTKIKLQIIQQEVMTSEKKIMDEHLLFASSQFRKLHKKNLSIPLTLYQL
jgi:hypothetical protein